MRITFIKLSGKSEPYAAIINGKTINRRCNESLANFQARCEEYLKLIQQ